MKAAGFVRIQENGEEIYNCEGSIFVLLAMQAALWKDRLNILTESQMLEEAIIRSLEEAHSILVIGNVM